MKKKIAITGGIGSGKSTLLHFLRELGYPVFSCDEIYKEVLRSSTYVEKIKARFPDCVVNETIDKKKLASCVFKDVEARLALNSIAHPLIMQALHEKMNACEKDFAFAEVPLLFECGFQNQFDRVIVVMRGEGNRISAVAKRDGLLPQEIQNRISAQFNYRSPQAQEIFNACNAICIDNDQTEEDLKQKTIQLLSYLRQS